MGYSVHFIPNPVNTLKIEFQGQKINTKIVIFLGINRSSYIKKGVAYFEKALQIIQEKYAEKVAVIITENLPYEDYIHLYNSAQIVLDQIYANDQGYNALEAMAKGKVVFTGGGKEFMDHYNLKERININALPDVDSLVNELSFLIENPESIITIGKRARAFIEKEHDYISVANQYLASWNSKTIS
jgi:glycosyltransferase involved in cell wall biosynthesis